MCLSPRCSTRNRPEIDDANRLKPMRRHVIGTQNALRFGLHLLIEARKSRSPMTTIGLLLAPLLLRDPGKSKLIWIEFGSSLGYPGTLAFNQFTQRFRLLLAALVSQGGIGRDPFARNTLQRWSQISDVLFNERLDPRDRHRRRRDSRSQGLLQLVECPRLATFAKSLQ